MILAADLLRILQGMPSPRHANERELQDRVADALLAAGVEHEREAELSRADRPDFTVKTSIGKVAIEVKVDGADNAIERQLTRYSRHGLAAIVVVSSRARIVHGLPNRLGRVPVYGVLMSRAFA